MHNSYCGGLAIMVIFTTVDPMALRRRFSPGLPYFVNAILAWLNLDNLYRLENSQGWNFCLDELAFHQAITSEMDCLFLKIVSPSKSNFRG